MKNIILIFICVLFFSSQASAKDARIYTNSELKVDVVKVQFDKNGNELRDVFNFVKFLLPCLIIS